MTRRLRFGNRQPPVRQSDKLTALAPAMKQNLISVICIVFVFAALAAAQANDSAKRQYQALCVGCHGEDGSGGGHGPGFLDVRRPRATSQEAVRSLILKGIPEGGM